MSRNFSPGRFCRDRSSWASCGSLLALLFTGCGASGGDGTPNANPAGSAGSAGAGDAEPAASGNGGSSFACPTGAEPSELVEVEAGEFIMGCNDEVDEECEADEEPMHVVTLAAFEIDRTEVTQEQYSACVLDGACPEPSCAWDCEKTSYPAGCIDWDAARNYCAWSGKRLPSEAEWEKAARGTEGNKYPWGDDEPDCSLSNFSECGEELLSVGSLPDGESPYGALDMAGNMVEMVADYYDARYYASSPEVDPLGPETGERYVGRGGGFRSDALWQRTAKRDWYDFSDAGASLGFRCAR